MTIPWFLTVSVSALLLIQYALLPLARKRWKVETSSAVVAKAATVGGLEFLRNIAICAVAASLLAVIAVMLVSMLGRGAPADIPEALRNIGALHERLESVNDGLSWLVFVVILTGLFFAARRSTRNRMSEVYSAAVDREVERLNQSVRGGTWEELEPTPAMQAASLKIEEAAVRLESPDLSGEERARLEAFREDMTRLWVSLDLQRRIKPQWDDFLEPPGDATRWQRIGNTVFSKGMFDSAGDLSRFGSRAAMVVLFLSLVGLNIPVVRAASESRWIRLSELQVKKDKEEALASAQRLPARDLDQLDEELIDELSRGFEQAFADMPAIRPAASSTRAVFTLRDMQVRRAILDEFAPIPGPGGGSGPGPGPGTAPEGLSQHPSFASTETLEPLEREAVSLYEEAHTSRGTRNSMGRAVARELRESGITRTSAWQRLRERRLAFGQPLTVHDLSNELVGRLVGDVLGKTVPEPATEYGKVLMDLQGQATENSLQQLFQIKRDQYIADIVSGMDPDGALARVVQDRPDLRAITASSRNSVQAAVRTIPTAETVLPKLEHHRPRLQWQDRTDVRAAVSAVRDAPSSLPLEERLALADQLATYEDFFPAQPSALKQTPRSQAINALASGAGRVAPGLEARTLARAAAQTGDDAARLLVNMASNAAAVSGFFRVGGVVIGQDPQGPAATRFRDLGWRMQGERIELWLVDDRGIRHDLGAFARSTAHLALGYAADDRRVAATMVSTGSPRTPLKILLHPALVDTELGMDVIELDRFVDVMARDLESGSVTAYRIAEAEERIRSHEVLYELAWAVRALRHGELSEEDRSYLRERLEILRGAPRAEQGLRDITGIEDQRISPVSAKPEFYDASLVALIRNCGRGNKGLPQFEQCVAASAGVPADNWLASPPSFEVWSGVRERAFTPEQGLGFLRPRSEMEPFRFLTQTAFTSPPEFANLSESEKLVHSDSRPWEFPAVQELIEAEIARGLRTDPDRREVLRSVGDFVVLQRLFRTILADGFTTQFPKQRLVALTRDTRGAGIRRVHTPRWNAAPGTLEQEVGLVSKLLLSQPGAFGPFEAARPVLQQCSGLIERRGQHLDRIPAPEWGVACDFSVVSASARAMCSMNSDAKIPCALNALDELSRARQIQKAMGGS